VITAVVTVAVTAAAAVVVAISGGATQQGRRFAGYYWIGHVWSVQGSWTVPRIVAGSPYGFGATWIAAQGPGKTRPFIQIGTNEVESPIGRGGIRTPTSNYWAFWSDTTHRFRGQYLFEVSPGDSISALLALRYDGWRLTITDRTTGGSQTFSTRDETGGYFNQAEWLQEHVLAPGLDDGYPRLSAISFGAIAVNDGAPDRYSLRGQRMTPPGMLPVAPSALAGDSFQIRTVPRSAR
jgi:hypothetical protein